MKQFTEEQVLKAIFESGLHQYVPGVITTRWKDGIDIDIPNHSLINFASKLFTNHEEEVKLAVAAEREAELNECIDIATEALTHAGMDMTSVLYILGNLSARKLVRQRGSQ